MRNVAARFRGWLLVGAALVGSGFPMLAPSGGAEVAVAAQPLLCAPPATQFQVPATAFAPPTPLVILNSPLLQVRLVGTGTFQGHVVLEPIAAPPPAISDGCQEDSRFTVTGFIGSLIATGDLADDLFRLPPPVTVLSATRPINASLEVHFGAQPSRPLLTFQSDTPVDSVIFGSVRFVQIVGGQVIHSR